ncbi:sortase, partial [[Clostridium] innocuum]
ICDIQTTDPQDTDLLEIQEGRDLVTLITCTPYGINTKRLLITGERVAYEKQEKESIQGSMMSIRELIFTAAPFVIVTLLLGKEIYHHRIRRSKGHEEAK